MGRRSFAFQSYRGSSQLGELDGRHVTSYLLGVVVTTSFVDPRPCNFDPVRVSTKLVGKTFLKPK